MQNTSPPSPFAGKTAFISGSSSGIGRAMAEEFGRRGMKVVVASIDEPEAERVAAGIEGASAVYLDVRDEASWIAALDTAEARHGPLAVLASNAGVAGSTAPITETTSHAWEWSRSVNLDGAFLGLIHGARRIMATGQPGHLLATSSMTVFAPSTRVGVYTGMKAAVLAFCEALRDELADRQIGISVLLPGPVRTPLLEANSSRAPEGKPVGADIHKLGEMLRNGLDPAEVGTLAANALGTDQFWLFTHPELEHRLEARFEEMKAALQGQHSVRTIGSV